MHQKQGRYAEAEAEFQKCLTQRLRLLGDDHADTLDTRSDLAELMLSQGRLEEADQLHRSVLEKQRLVLSANDTRIAKSLIRLGRCSLQRSRRDGDVAGLEASASELEDGLAIYHTARLLDHPETLDAQWTLAQVVCEQRRYAAAARLLVDLVDRQHSIVAGRDVVPTTKIRRGRDFADGGE